MSTLAGLFATLFVSAGLAVATVAVVVDVGQQTPQNTPSVSEPLIVYGQR
ncbi:MAG TPA: hypothetical protein VGD72_09900 [Mycobacteriales bacterium]|jgi:hypothetical protein